MSLYLKNCKEVNLWVITNLMTFWNRHTVGAVWLAIAVLALAPVAQADESGIEAAGHLIEAENALNAGDYLKAATEYRRAAELSDDVQVAKQATEVGMRLGFNEQALASVERWRELAPDDDESRVYYMRIHLRLGNIRKARKEIEEVIEQGDGKADQRLLQLLPLLSDEDPQYADELMRQLAKPYKDSAAANFATAVMALQAGDAEWALEKAGKAIELEPNWLRPKLVKARSLLLDGQVDEATEYMARIVGDDPHADADSRMELALMYLTAGRDDDALSQVSQILLEQPSRTDALRLMAIINFRQGNLDVAEDDFNDLLSSGDYTMDALYYLARIADYESEYDRAVRLYSQVRSGQNTVTSQRRAAAIVALELDDPEDAVHRLDTFADRNPEHAVDMVLAKAQLFAALERYEESLAYYNKVAEFRPDEEGVALGRAELMLRMGRLDDAIEGYRYAVKQWPDSPTSLNALGYTLADRTDQFREAEKLIKKALKYEPDNAAIIDSLGWVYFKTGRYEAALEQLEIAYSRFPDHEVASHIVDTLIELGREDEALAFLVEAEVKDPDSDLLAEVRGRRFPGTQAAAAEEEATDDEDAPEAESAPEPAAETSPE